MSNIFSKKMSIRILQYSRAVGIETILQVESLRLNFSLTETLAMIRACFILSDRHVGMTLDAIGAPGSDLCECDLTKFASKLRTFRCTSKRPAAV